MPLSWDDLTSNQQQKCAHFLPIYNEDEQKSIALTLLLERSGENGFKRVTDKLDSLQHGDFKMQQYDDGLYDAFPIGELQTPSKIIGTVGIVRTDMVLPAYISSLKTNCERDFFKLFIVKTIYQEQPVKDIKTGEATLKQVKIGYIPLFRLKSED